MAAPVGPHLRPRDWGFVAPHHEQDRALVMIVSRDSVMVFKIYFGCHHPSRLRAVRAPVPPAG
eukprot:3852725-Pleurochrysis_carterae.AAC.1